MIGHHDAAVEIAVIGVPDAEFGQRLRAFVVRRAGAGVSADELRAHLRAQVARFKVLRDIVFVDECREMRWARSCEHGCVDVGQSEPKSPGA